MQYRARTQSGLGSRTAGEITRRDVLDLLEKKAVSAPVRANRLLALIRKIYSSGIDNDLVSVSPAAGVKAPTKEHSRDRVLSDTELALIWRASERLEWPWQPYTRLLLLTGQRRGEVASMRWQDIDLEAGNGTIPAEFPKNSCAHDVPLSAQAQDVVAKLPRFANSPFVFPARGQPQNPISGFGKAKAALDREMTRLLRQEAEDGGRDPEKAMLATWRLHDLRRTPASGLARLGFGPHVLAAVLSHSAASVQRITAVYNRHRYEEEKRQALEAWADHILAVAERRAQKVRHVASL